MIEHRLQCKRVFSNFFFPYIRENRQVKKNFENNAFLLLLYFENDNMFFVIIK